MYPTEKSPERAIALQEYLLLHSRRESLEKALNRRALSNPDDVADAFQATFLITEKGVHDRDHCRR